MAILNLKSDEYAVINGWYGKCHDEEGNVVDINDCPQFDLSSAQDKIKSVYWSESDGTIRSFESGSSLNDFTMLKCGASYLIYLQKGTGTLNIPNFVASFSDLGLQGRITDDCSTGSGSSDFAFTTISEISDEVDIGYKNTDSTEYDAEEHFPIVNSANGLQSLDISANGNGIEFTTNGTTWTEISNSQFNITSNFTNLKFRLKEGRSATFTRSITLKANPENSMYIPIQKTITYTVKINDVSLTVSDTITEELEEGKPGSVHSFDISFENLGGLGIISDNQLHKISTSENGTFGDSISIPNPSSSPITIFVKLDGNMPASDVTTNFTITGEKRNISPDIRRTNAVTITSTVAPRPQITSLSVNPTTLAVSINFTNENNYGGHHWHYNVKKKSDSSIIVSTQMPTFDANVILNQNDFTEATTFVLTAFIVTQGHDSIAGSDTKTAEFTIAENPASLSINKSGVSGVVDIDDQFPITTVAITSNNLTNIRYSKTSFNNWEFRTTPTDTGFTIQIDPDVKSLSNLDSGPRVLPQETFTITGDVGPRDNSGDSTKFVTFTMDQTIVDNAEFSVTAPGGNFTVTDTRNYGTDIPEFGPFTINSDAVVLSSNELNNWEVKIGNGAYTKSPDFSTATNGTTFSVRQSNVSVGTYNETLTLTPTAKPSDNDPLDNPGAIDILLTGKINANVASLSNPGKQTLTSIVSGGAFSTKTFTVSGQFIENITISNVSENWSVTPASPSVGSTVTISYIGSNEPTGIKSGSFTISAEPVTGATLNTSSYDVDLEVTIRPKTSSITTDSSVTLDSIVSGFNSDIKTLNVSSDNVQDITIKSIPSGFIVKNGTTTLGVGTSIGTGAELSISLADIDTVGTRSGSLVLEGTSSTNSAFANGNTVNVSLSASVTGRETSLSINPTTINDSVNQYESLPSAHLVTVSQEYLSNVKVSGGSSTTYQVSETETGTYANSINSLSGNTFYVKLRSTQSSSSFSRNLVVSGTKSSIGKADPAQITLKCTATINPFSASLNITPTSVSETYDKNATATTTEISITSSNVASISITASGKYSVTSTASGSPVTSMNLSNPTSSEKFYVVCNDTSVVGSATGTITVVGTHTLGGGSTTKTLSCSATINEVDTGGGDGDCCEGMTKIPTNTGGVASILMQSAPGYSVCCKPKMQFTLEPPNNYVFAVQLNGGDVIGQIQVAQRTGGISSTTFDSTVFIVEDPDGNFYEADLGGLTGGQIDFLPKDCGGGGTGNDDCCANQTEIPTNTGGVASILMQSGPGYILCCDPKMQFTLEPPNNYVFAVQLNGGGVIGQIQVAQRTGGISSTTFNSTVFTIKDADGICYTADLGGMTGGQINFTN